MMDSKIVVDDATKKEATVDDDKAKKVCIDDEDKVDLSKDATNDEAS